MTETSAIIGLSIAILYSIINLFDKDKRSEFRIGALTGLLIGLILLLVSN